MSRAGSVVGEAVRARGSGGCRGVSRGLTARISGLSSDLRPDAPYSGGASAICTGGVGTRPTRHTPAARRLRGGAPATRGFSSRGVATTLCIYDDAALTAPGRARRPVVTASALKGEFGHLPTRPRRAAAAIGAAKGAGSREEARRPCP